MSAQIFENSDNASRPELVGIQDQYLSKVPEFLARTTRDRCGPARLDALLD
jgi:hypothetical protein